MTQPRVEIARPSVLRVQPRPAAIPDAKWARLLLFTLSVHIPGLGLVPVAAVLAIWRFGTARRELPRSGRWLLPATVAAIVMGFLLRLAVNSPTIGSLSSSLAALEVTLWFLAIPLQAISGAYALRVLGWRSGLFWVAAGAVVGNLAYYGVDNDNPWKYTLAYPVTLIVFYVVGRRHRGLGLVLLAGAALIGVSFALHARSAGALVAVAVLMGMVPALRSRRRVAGRAIALALVALISFVSLTSAMEAGWLGREAQYRYELQTREGHQSVITGGRVETQAALSLFQTRPQGFGIGVEPTGGMQRDALVAVRAVGGDVASGYYQRNVFTERVDLHSMVSNLWFYAGAFGLVLAGLILASLARGGLSIGAAALPTVGLRTMALYAVAAASWDVLFSPMAQIDRVSIGLERVSIVGSVAAGLIGP